MIFVYTYNLDLLVPKFFICFKIVLHPDPIKDIQIQIYIKFKYFQILFLCSSDKKD